MIGSVSSSPTIIWPAGVLSLTLSGISNEGGISAAGPLLVDEELGEVAGLGPLPGRMPMSWTGLVIGWPRNDHFIIAGVSIVGAIATTSSPAD